MAHNYVYRTKIQSGIILMCSKDKLFQKFESSDKEFVGYQHAFLRKVDEYYRDHKDKKTRRYTKIKRLTRKLAINCITMCCIPFFQ